MTMVAAGHGQLQKHKHSGVNIHSALILSATLCIAAQNLSIGVNVVYERSPFLVGGGALDAPKEHLSSSHNGLS